MNNESSNDNLDELFRRHLDGYEEAPPEEVWQGIRPRLRQKRRPFGGWLAALFLLTALVGGIVFWENGQEKRLQKLEEQLATQPASAQKSGSLYAEKQEQVAPENPAANEAAASQLIENQPPRQASVEIFSTKKTRRANRSTATPPLAQANILEKEAPPSASVSLQKLPPPDSFLTQKLPPPDRFAPLSEEPMPTVFADADRLNAPVWQSVFSTQENSPPHLKTGLQVAPVKFRPAVEVYFNSAFALSFNHLAKKNSEITPDLGYRWHAGVLVELAAAGRWSLLTGFDFGVLAPIAYDEAVFEWNENQATTLPDGSVVNNVSFVATTALGKTFVQAQVKKNAENVNSGEAYLMRVVTQSKVELMTVPMVGKYRLSRGRFSTFLKAGVASSHVRFKEVNLLKINVLNTERWSVLEAKTAESLTEMQRHFLQGALGFGVAWRFNRHFSLLAEPTWSFSFSPLNQRLGQDIRPQALGLQVAGRVEF